MNKPKHSPAIRSVKVNDLHEHQIQQVYDRLSQDLGDSFHENIEHLDSLTIAYDVAEFMKCAFARQESQHGLCMSNSETRGASEILGLIQDLMTEGTNRRLIMEGELARLKRPDPHAPKVEL